MTTKVGLFSEIEAQFNDYVSDIVYATMTTVDRSSRLRSRILIPIWEVVDGEPVGWLASYKTPVKATHLAANPHTTFSYWSPRQNAVHIDSVTRWTEDPVEKRRTWELYRTGSPPGAGYDPARFWAGGHSDPGYHVARISPWRVQVVRGADLASTIWQKRVTDVAPDTRSTSGASSVERGRCSASATVVGRERRSLTVKQSPECWTCCAAAHGG